MHRPSNVDDVKNIEKVFDVIKFSLMRLILFCQHTQGLKDYN